MLSSSNMSSSPAFRAHPYITAGLVDQARELFANVYNKNADDFTESCLGRLRDHKFLNKKSTLLKLLPPTEKAFFHHLKRVALATAVDRSAHINKPQIPSHEEYGWTLNTGELVL